MQLLDTNGDGHIDINEFLVAIRVSKISNSNRQDAFKFSVDIIPGLVSGQANVLLCIMYICVSVCSQAGVEIFSMESLQIISTQCHTHNP